MTTLNNEEEDFDMDWQYMNWQGTWYSWEEYCWMHKHNIGPFILSDEKTDNV